MSSSDQQPRVYGNRYEIDHRIARGGMAEVFLARDRFLDRPVALKVLFPELSVDPSFVERFRREAQNAARLSHPNIVSVYDWGEDGSTYFIVMEYVEGKPLSAVLREGPLSAQRAATIGAEVAAALSFAHRHGVVHRDVKPGNVLIDERGGVKVTDFGIARARNTTENLTQTGAVMGTATYFSPEQAQGLVVDQRSDVYSLGVVLYEMVAGRPPFTGDNPVTIAYKHVREQPVALRHVDPSVPADYESITAQAMAKSPAQRYATAEDLRADLDRFGRGQPVLAITALAANATQAVPRISGEHRTVQQAYQDSTRTIPAATPPPPGPFPKTPAKHKGATAFIIFLGLVALLAIAALILFSKNAFTVKQRVSVPSVVTKSVSDAETILRQAKLDYVEVRGQNNAAVDQVFGQDPAAGSSVKESTKITLQVSNGPGPITLSDFTNQSLDTARSTLSKLGLQVTTTDAPSASVDKGKVISQDPPAGQAVDKGSTVTLTISSGPEQVEVPNVNGYTISAAAQILSTAGLRTTYSADTDPSALVDHSDPSPGTSVAKGATVTLVAVANSSSTTTSTTPGDSGSTTTTSSSTTSTTTAKKG